MNSLTNNSSKIWQELFHQQKQQQITIQHMLMIINIDSVFTSYHASSSQLKQLSGREAGYQYWLDSYWKAWGCK